MSKEESLWNLLLWMEIVIVTQLEGLVGDWSLNVKVNFKNHLLIKVESQLKVIISMSSYWMRKTHLMQIRIISSNMVQLRKRKESLEWVRSTTILNRYLRKQAIKISYLMLRKQILMKKILMTMLESSVLEP